MNKLFAKVLTATVSVLAAFFATSCTEPNTTITGTAEERNQTANAGEKNTEENLPTTQVDSLVRTTSSSAAPSSGTSKSTPVGSDSIAVLDSVTSHHFPDQGFGGAYSSARAEYPLSGDGKGGAGGVVGASSSSSTTTEPNIAGHVDENLLSVYVKKTGINGISFDGAVYGINKTYQSCDLSTSTCSENEPIEEYRRVGLHKVALEKIEDIAEIFPMTYAALPIDQIKISYTDECALYVLNVSDTSPVWRVLTSISTDSIVVKEIYDKCDYEARPFKVHVGFLFSYCRELGSSTKIVQEGVPNGDANCSDVSYEEYYKK